MSYLNSLRLAFSGKFQSDVSTINNDVRHFDNSIFKESYQDYGTGATNGWWNPCGSGAFRLIDCQVSQVCYSDGSETNSASKDPVVGMLIGGSDCRVSGKMVDLDPQMQMVSEIWGLNMRLTDGKTPGFFDGNFLRSPFRDILFGRQQGGSGGDQTAAAIYQSILCDLKWSENSVASRFLQELRQAVGDDGELSVRMMTFAYNMDHTNANFTIGQVSGVIGPAFTKEPKTFVLGRRFAPANGTATKQNINFFNAQLDTNSYELIVDLSNALPLSGGEGDFVDIGELQLVVLLKDSKEGVKNLSESKGDYLSLGKSIPYLQKDWMKNSGAIYATKIPESQLKIVQTNPLALLNIDKGINEVMIRESQDGLLVRADTVVHRMNPSANGVLANSATDFYASRYGVPASGETIKVSVAPPQKGAGGGDPKIKMAPPVINIPADKIILHDCLPTDQDGKTNFSFSANNPENPRGYIDGQIYILDYQPAGAEKYVQYVFDSLMLHVYDVLELSKHPTWTDIQPLMQQYGNLYPVMSRMLVNLGQYESVVEHRAILELAFSLPEQDPNYMPVTRDLSDGWRAAILQWLTEQDENGNYILRRENVEDTSKSEPTPCSSCSLDSAAATKKAMITAEAEAETLDSESKMGSKEFFNHHYIKGRTETSSD